MLIVDARVRPPIEMFKDTKIYGTSVPGMVARIKRYGPVDSALEQRSVPLLAEQLRAAGIAHAIVPGRAANPMLGGGHADSLTRLTNEYPSTFSALTGVDALTVSDPATLVKEIQAAGHKGVAVEPGICDGHCHFDDARLFPLYEALESARLVVYALTGGSAGPDVTYSDPSHVDRVAMRFPRLQIVMVHGGYPYVQETCGVVYRRSNVWLLPDMYFPDFPGEADYLIAAKTFAEDRFLYGTSYPLCPIDKHLSRFLELPLPDSTKEKILGLNAKRLFDLHLNA